MSIMTCNVCSTTRDTDYLTDCIFCNESDAESTISFLFRKYDVEELPKVENKKNTGITPMSEYPIEELQKLYPETI
jgi:hypothetical protein